MKKLGMLACGVALIASTAAMAGSASDANDMINQLVPSDAAVTPAEEGGSILTVQAASKAEIVNRLDDPTRSIGDQPRAVALPSLTKGNETEVLRALKGLPSVQVAVAFQGASDALAPESGALLGALSQALTDPRVAASRIMIGVHTNAVGSDEYNLDLSTLRAKAIVDTLASVHGVARNRLIPFGFGRAVEGSVSNANAEERIQVVNLGSAAAQEVEKPVVAAPVITHPALFHPNFARSATHAHRIWALHVRSYPVFAVVRAYTPAAHPVHHVIRPRDDAGGQPRTAAFDVTSPAVAHPGGGGAGGGGGGGGGSGGGGGGGGGGWSDRRLKRHVRRVGASPNGHALYSFQYVWGGPFFVGVMAQEVMKTCPEAVTVGPGGYLMVDYDRLGFPMMALSDWEAESAHGRA